MPKSKKLYRACKDLAANNNKAHFCCGTDRGAECWWCVRQCETLDQRGRNAAPCAKIAFLAQPRNSAMKQEGRGGRLHDNVEKAIRPFNGAPSALHACSSSPILSLMFFSTEWQSPEVATAERPITGLCTQTTCSCLNPTSCHRNHPCNLSIDSFIDLEGTATLLFPEVPQRSLGIFSSFPLNIPLTLLSVLFFSIPRMSDSLLISMATPTPLTIACLLTYILLATDDLIAAITMPCTPQTPTLQARVPAATRSKRTSAFRLQKKANREASILMLWRSTSKKRAECSRSRQAPAVLVVDDEDACPTWWTIRKWAVSMAIVSRLVGRNSTWVWRNSVGLD